MNGRFAAFHQILSVQKKIKTTPNKKSFAVKPRDCRWCGTTFTPRESRRKLCSAACNIANARRGASAYFKSRQVFKCGHGTGGRNVIPTRRAYVTKIGEAKTCFVRVCRICKNERQIKLRRNQQEHQKEKAA